MYKKLMFLISLVCLLGMASSLSAVNLQVDWPDVYTVLAGPPEEYDEITCSGTIIVDDGATLVMHDESELDGNGDLGPGNMEGASIIVYGTFIMHNRLNMGTDHDAYLIIDGGIVQHDGDKVTVPDNSGGEHRIIILNGGSMVAEEIEIIADRNAKVILGCNATIEVCNTDEGCSRTPSCWAVTDCSGGGKALECYSGCAGVMTITDLGGNCEEAICLLIPPEAWGPTPKDGAVGQVVTVDLEWKPGVGATMHMIYFGTSYDGVLTAGVTDPQFQGPRTIGDELWDLDVTPTTLTPPKPAIFLELWKTYYWRVDEITPPNPAPTKGNVWSFTTGCALMPGDINLDCLVNLLDYAMLADDWQEESFFPTNVP